MTRITFTQINNLVQTNLSRNYSKMSRLQELLSSGKRIQKPSDAPSEVTNDLQLRSHLDKLSQYKRNINDGKNYLAIAESTMNSTNDLYQRMRELAIQASNDTNTGSERVFIMNEIRVILDQLVSISNTSYRGNFIFSGTETDTQPYDMIRGSERIDELDNSGTDPTDSFLSSADPMPKTVQIWDRNVSDSNTVNGNARVYDIVPGTFNIAGLTEGTDYTVDYVRGTLTFLETPRVNVPGVGNLTRAQIQAADLASNPGWPPPGDPAWGGAVDQPQPGGGVVMDYDWIRRSEKDLDGTIHREIEKGLVTQINTTASEVFGSPGENTTWDSIVLMMDGLHNNQGDVIRTALTGLNGALERSLSAQAVAGARNNRMSTTLDRNETSFIETTDLHSKIEDVDFAQTISDFVLQEAVYTASLQSASRVIQPTLGNFL